MEDILQIKEKELKRAQIMEAVLKRALKIEASL